MLSNATTTEQKVTEVVWVFCTSVIQNRLGLVIPTGLYLRAPC